MTVYKKLMNVQSELKAPKGNYNSFGKYSYRSAEDVLEAVKPILKKEGLALIIKDDIVEIGGRFYVKSTASVIDIETGEKEEAVAYAREDETKKGMDLAQVTGSCSSYSRKYALNGLFAIDSSELDPDKTNTHGKDSEQKPTQSSSTITEKQRNFLLVKAKENNFTEAQILQVIKKEFNLDSIMNMNKTQFDNILSRVQKK
ncbi:MAG: ERF family protein [Clostridium sp.]|nr:ERF family protein [Clostridium sp.]